MATDYNSNYAIAKLAGLLKEHTPAQREHFLLRHPNVDPATLPPVEQRPDHRQVHGYVNGRRVLTWPTLGERRFCVIRCNTFGRLRRRSRSPSRNQKSLCIAPQSMSAAISFARLCLTCPLHV